MTRPIVFLGPSLPRAEAQSILDADYRPPIRQGDLLRALTPRPPAIAIIDGIFTHVPTVRHREILWALSEGIPIFGAASMGALRAAELHGSGMIGHGLIYRWYRLYALLPDDAVAVAHAPAELGAQPLSLSLVDLRRSLTAARRADALSPQRAAALTTLAQSLPFQTRTPETLTQIPQERAALATHRIFQKADDSRSLLRLLADHNSKSLWPSSQIERPAIVHAWLDDLTVSGFDTSAFVRKG